MYRQIPNRRQFGWQDILILGFVCVFIYVVVGVAKQWIGVAAPLPEIDLSPAALPWYALLSLSRAVFAYGLSLIFSLVYGYIAAKSRRADRVMIPFLDVLQSIPVFGFLPGLVTGLSALFPNSNIGLELACATMIFTGQAWNMTYSFYTSVRSVPSELAEVSTVMGLSRWERFKKLELPISAIPLAWNSLMSMAGGWFFITVCESFTLGERQFRLPGIGSYMSVAIAENNHEAMAYGVFAMAVIILFVDFVIWRPVMVWVRKFQMEEVEEEISSLPFVTNLLRESRLLRRITLGLRRWRKSKAESEVSSEAVPLVTRPLPSFEMFRKKIWGKTWGLGRNKFSDRLVTLAYPLAIAAAIFGLTRLWELVRTLNWNDWRLIWGSVGLTFSRVVLATLVGALWTIPVGIVIGLSPRWTRIFQPIVQLFASFPAPMLYPVILSLMFSVGLTLHWGSAILMMLGVQWYILFNVLAGTMGVTREFKDIMTCMNVSRWGKWKSLFLPAVFPSLVNGLFNAMGGAWNASIVAEYLHYQNKIYSVPGIGSLISRSTADANYPLLAGGLIAMVLTVVGLNQTFWRWLQDLADRRFRFER